MKVFHTLRSVYEEHDFFVPVVWCCKNQDSSQNQDFHTILLRFCNVNCKRIYYQDKAKTFQQKNTKAADGVSMGGDGGVNSNSYDLQQQQQQQPSVQPKKIKEYNCRFT